ncbi:MAG: S1/P1 Nuclease [Bacteroidetes bacterium]|nr:S1/P1 Nuclease [Bacteroidota bacterium]
MRGELFHFYKKYINDITEKAVNPDKRRYAVAQEGGRHYLDADHYEKALPFDTIPHNWDQAVKKFTKDTLLEYGILPWYLKQFKSKLTEAFEQKNVYQIIKLSADMGHYCADLHVPLHSTINYNGQFTNQRGIHSLFESRMYELYRNNYDFITNKAKYIENLDSAIWYRFSQSFAAKDSVFLFEKVVSKKLPDKFVLKTKGKNTTKVYHKEFCNYYNMLLNGMIERRIRASIEFVGSMWLTCWIDAGQPDLSNLDYTEPDKTEDTPKKEIDKLMKKGKIKGRTDD